MPDPTSDPFQEKIKSPALTTAPSAGKGHDHLGLDCVYLDGQGLFIRVARDVHCDDGEDVSPLSLITNGPV